MQVVVTTDDDDFNALKCSRCIRLILSVVVCFNGIKTNLIDSSQRKVHDVILSCENNLMY